MVCMWIDKRVRKGFKHWGVLVARRPETGIFIPIIATVLLGYFGLIQVGVEDNFDALFTPSNSQAQQDVARLQTLGFEPSDLTLQAAARVIVQASDGGNVLREDIIQEVLRLHDMASNVGNDRGENFTTLCRNSSTDGTCYGNNVVRLLITNGSSILNDLRYPYNGADDSNNSSGQYIGDELGGVWLRSDEITVREAKALQLSYHLKAPGGQWTENFRQAIESFTSDNITVTYLTATSLSRELGGMPGRLLPYLGGCAGMVALYSVLSCMMVDCVRSEPWLGLMGSLTSLMALTSAVGLLQLCGQKLSILEMAAIFILTGSKVGNTYTLLWAWRRTDPTLSVRHRMGAAMADAAGPMTIGSLTDYVTYAVGMATSFEAVRSFCVLAVTSAAFCGVYQLMFFAAFLALSGHREDGNRHCLTCVRVRTSSQSSCYALCCAGDGMPSAQVEKRLSVMRNATKEDMQNPLLLKPSKVIPRVKNASLHSASTFPLYQNQTEHTDSPQNPAQKTADPILADFFSSYLGQWLKNPWMKFVIVLVYLAYLGAAIRGCVLVAPGLNHNNLAADDSHISRFATQETEHFSQYGPRIDLVVSKREGLTDEEVRDEVEAKLQSFSQSSLFHNTYDAWLRSYIDTSRVTVVGKEASTNSRQREIMREARRIATTGDVEMLAYAPQFALYEQSTTVLPEAAMLTGIAAAAIYGATFLLVPHWTGGFVVVTSGASVMVGVIGYMAFWDIMFDVVSTAAILASVAMATDLPAHVTYAYVVAFRTSKTNNCVAAAMHTAGMPVAQSAVSTILSVVLLAVFPAETYRIFFRIILLTALFSTAHSLFFLPVLLSFMSPCFPGTNSHRKKAGSPSEGGRTNADESGVNAPWQEHLDQLDKHISLWEQTEFRSTISDATPSAIGSRMLSTFSSLSTSPTADSLYRGRGERQNNRKAPQRSNSMFEGPRTSLDLSLFETRQREQIRRMSSRDVIMPSARLANQQQQERSVTDGPHQSRRLYKYGKKEAQDSMRYRLVFPHEEYYRQLQATRNGNPVVHRREGSGESASRPKLPEDAPERSRAWLHKQDSRISVISNPRSVSSIEEELITPRAVVGHPLPGMPKRNSRLSREPSRDFSSPRDHEHMPRPEMKTQDARMSLPAISQLPDPVAGQQQEQRRSVDQANTEIRYSGDKKQKIPNKLINAEMKAWIGWVMDLKRQDMEVSII